MELERKKGVNTKDETPRYDAGGLVSRENKEEKLKRRIKGTRR